MSNEIKTKEEVICELYAQAEKQLVESFEKAEKAFIDAQNTRISVQAQLALIRKINVYAEQWVATNKQEIKQN